MSCIIPRCFSLYNKKLSVHSSGPQGYSLSSISFIPTPQSLHSHPPLLYPFVLVFNSFLAPSLFSYFPVNGLISFYAGAQQINRYCIMAKTGKAPLCP